MAKFWFCLFVCLSAAGFLTNAGKKEGKDKTSKKPVHIYEVNPNELEDIIESNEEVLVLFYDSKDVKSKPIISKMDKLDFAEFDIPVVKISDETLALEYGVEGSELPSVVLFQRGIPEEYPEDLNAEGFTSFTQWIKEELSGDDIPVLDLNQVERVAKKGKPIFVMFVEDANKPLVGEKSIIKVTDQFDIGLVKVESSSPRFGIRKVPAFVYFENNIPTLYDEDPHDPKALVEWIEEQRTSDAIEVVTEEILQHLVQTQDYLAVFFTGPCNKRALQEIDLECSRVLQELEEIDDELDDFGIPLVTTVGIKYAGTVLKVRKFPSLGIFRNGQFLAHEGSLDDERQLLNWLVDEETLEIPGKIEKVNPVMLQNILDEEPNVVVYFYAEDYDKKAADILKVLEVVDDKLEKTDVSFVKFADDDFALEEFGLSEDDLPKLIFFDNQIPVEFPEDGKMTDEKEVTSWILEQVESQAIRIVEPEVLDRLVDKTEDLVAIFYDPTRKKHQEFVDDLENVDDDAEALDIFMVKLDSTEHAKRYGLYSLPAVVHFEDGIPNVYDEDMTKEAVMAWLTDQKTGSFIEKVTPALLQRIIKEEDYVVVLFLSNCDKTDRCEEILSDLEEIDEQLENIGILFVYTDDETYAAKLKVTAFPTIAYFRNGERLMYEGSIENEMAVLKFATDLEHIKIPGQIAEVGVSLLEFMMDERKDVFAFLYDEEDGRSKKILQRLEAIDDNLEKDNILLVKCSDDEVEEVYGIGYLPRLIYFEDGVPEPYKGDEMDERAILRWIGVKLKEDKIKSVTRSVLDKLIEKFPHMGVIFVDDENKAELEIVNQLETGIDVIREEELIVVQIDDADYARQLGLRDPPTLVHFSSGVPSIYYGEEKKDLILKWLIHLKEEAVIEVVTEEILTDLIEEEEYVMALFSGECLDSKCKTILDGLETIDDELDGIRISFVQTRDEDYPFKVHAIETLPALGLYRNKNFLIYDGDLSDEEAVRKWAMDEETLQIDGQIEEINVPLLNYFYENNDKLVVLFYESDDRDADEIIEGLEEIDDELEKDEVSFVKISEEGSEEQFGILELPSLAFIQNGIPNIYEGDLMDYATVLAWIEEEAKTTRIHEVTDILLEKLTEKMEFLGVVFYDMEDDPTVEDLQVIAEGCHENGIGIVKINDVEEAEEYGLTEMPVVVLFENRVPTVFTGDIEDEDEVLEWLVKHKAGNMIEEMTDNMLADLIEEHEYVAVYFRGDCENKDDSRKVDCNEVLAELETINEDLDEIGIMLITTSGTEVATENGVQELPAIGLFRNGQFVQYEGDETSEKQILAWLTDEETLKIIGVIDEVNLAMLENILEEEDDAFVFFYEDNDTDAHTILEELEQIDEKLDKQDLTMVKISDSGASEAFGIEDIPCLVYFESGVPEVYKGDLLNDNAIMKWMMSELKQEEIKEITVPMLEKLVERGKTMAVLFYDPNDDEDHAIMDELEKIDDDCRRFEIDFVKVSDAEEAKEYGIDTLPSVLYFENKIPSLYDEDLNNENELLEWLIEQKTTDTIEHVTEEILEFLIEDEEYLAVFFSGPCEEDDPCDDILEDLETVDSTMGDYGIMLVTTEERDLAKKFEVLSFPALGLFRNGEYIPFEGDLNDEMRILEWITDKETLLISGKIEKVNSDMLDKLISTETDILVFLYRENNLADHDLIDQLEEIDDELEEKEIELVKCSDRNIEKEYGFGFTPVLVHFHAEVPSIYRGDLEESNEILLWLLANLEKSEIEEVSGPVLDVLIERLNDLVVIFFDDDDPEDKTFLDQMEQLDDDCDKISIPIVKISDKNKALQFGLEDTPAVLYFKRQIPGIYDGPLDTKILEWMTARKQHNQIQLVSEQILEDIVDTFPFVSVLFTGKCGEKDGEDCQDKVTQIVAGLENINDDINNIGIEFVMTKEKKMGRQECGISSFPALALFRNGDHCTTYTGSLDSEVEIWNWISDIETIEVEGIIEEVNIDMLQNIIELEDEVCVLFYHAEDGDVEDILESMETLDDNMDAEEVEFVKCSDEDAVSYYGLTVIPSLVYFEHGVPAVYNGDLKNDDTVLGWITKELRETGIKEVNAEVLNSILERLDYVAVVYYDKERKSDQDIIHELEAIDDDCKQNDIRFVKISDHKLFSRIGVEESPVVVYYENDVPFLYQKKSLSDPATLLKWLIEQRNSAAIEHVTDAMLEDVIEEHEYVAVLFTGLCADDDDREECSKVIDSLEKIDTNLDEYGIVFVMSSQLDKARQLWIGRFPALAFFRNGEYVKYNGDLTKAKTVFKWLTASKQLFVPDKVEEVNDLLLAKMVEREKSLFVFFYIENDIFSQQILRTLEELDNSLDDANVNLVKISDEGIDEEYEIDELPALVYFKSGEPHVFFGDLKQESQISQWIEKQNKLK